VATRAKAAGSPPLSGWSRSESARYLVRVRVRAGARVGVWVRVRVRVRGAVRVRVRASPSWCGRGAWGDAAP
jgi:hypothetical protein